MCGRVCLHFIIFVSLVQTKLYIKICEVNSPYLYGPHETIKFALIYLGLGSLNFMIQPLFGVKFK